MISADDMALMQADLLAVRDDNPVSIVIRRGSTNLSAQTVRIARLTTQGKQDSESQGGSESRAKVVVLGSTSLDVQVDDRFTSGGILYRVYFVRPNKTAAVVAEADAVE